MTNSMSNTPRPRPAVKMTEEERKEKEREAVNQYILQRQTEFSLNIVTSMCHGLGNITEAEGIAIVDRAYEMAKHLCKRLYTNGEE